MIALLYVVARNTNNINIGELPLNEIINSEELQIYFFNVGQADCILARNDGKNMLIDAGDNEDGSLLVEYIKRLGITRIDYLIGTYVHEDHLGGMDNIIKEFKIGDIYILKFDELDTELIKIDSKTQKLLKETNRTESIKNSKTEEVTMLDYI